MAQACELEYTPMLGMEWSDARHVVTTTCVEQAHLIGGIAHCLADMQLADWGIAKGVTTMRGSTSGSTGGTGGSAYSVSASSLGPALFQDIMKQCHACIKKVAEGEDIKAVCKVSGTPAMLGVRVLPCASVP